jgi:signal transduction histidine kinase
VSTFLSHCVGLPTLSEGSDQALHLESVLQDLPVHSFRVDVRCLGSELVEIFEKHPLLPGAILVEEGATVGMISRRRLLEYLIRPYGMELFLQEALWVLHRYTRCDVLLLPGDTPILVAAQQALRRSPELLSEPIVVEIDNHHHLLDVHELNIAHWQIRGIETQVRYERTQAEMIQNSKMVNLGRLVDGVAHEILDPVSFIWGNLSHVTNYSQDLLTLLAAYENHLPTLPQELEQLREDIEVEYLRQDLPRAIASIKTGAERLSKLASSLQNFCHIDEVYPKPMDLHECLDSILLLLKSRLSSEIRVVRNYGSMPPVSCFPGQLNQVFMNILSSAVNRLLDEAVAQQLHADFKASSQSNLAIAPAPPTLEITTQICSLPAVTGTSPRWVSICIADNGQGLSPEAEQKLLESFSVKGRTEKETSLSVSYQIITAKHGGKLKVRSRGMDLGADDPAIAQGQQTGTEFEILLPLV